MTKEKILISTIVRNRSDKLDTYYNQLINFVNELNNDFDFSISIYENDSIDDSKIKIKSYDYSLFKKNNIILENINTEFYGSINDANRVLNLANARNKTINSLNIDEYDWLLIIEPDVIYDLNSIKRIITRSDLNFKPDIYSGILMMNNVPYDKWATRRNNSEEWGDFFDNYTNEPIKEFWSTFNGVCLYNMEPFKNGIRFSSFNKRFKRHDCDTVVICENFRDAGYNKIFINQSILLTHMI